MMKNSIEDEILEDIDSLTSATTSYMSSSFDEQSVTTPPPMHGRLGRIIMPTSLDDSSDSIESNGRTRINSYRYRNIQQGAINRPRTSNYLKSVSDEEPNQYEVLSCTLNQLNRLASLNSTEYQQRLLENSLPDNSNLCSQTSSLSSQSFQTPLIQLSMSIHRLHAVVANVTREVNGHPDEVQELQSQLSTLRLRNRQLETAVKKVHKKNLKLKQLSQQDRKVSRRLQHKVHEYKAELEAQGHELMTSKVQQHEIQLQLSSRNHNGNNCKTPRDRIDSNMSDFLDIEQEIEGDTDETIQTINQNLLVEQKSEENNITTVGISKEDNEITRTHSLFEDTAPTLRYSAQGSTSISLYGRPSSPSQVRKPTHSVGGSSIAETSSSACPVDDDDYLATITSSPSSLSPNIRKDSHHEPSVDDGDTESLDDSNTAASLAMPSIHSSFAKLLGCRPIQNYTLKINNPCNMQFATLQVQISNEENNNTSNNDNDNNDSESLRSQGSSPLPRNIVFDEDNDIGCIRENDVDSSSQDDHCSTSMLSATFKTETAFAVSGFRGFDTNQNVTPTLGARLIEINGESVDAKWTLEDLYFALSDTSKSTSSTKNQKSIKALTFRNEIWDKDQTKDLKIHYSRLEKYTDTLSDGKEQHTEKNKTLQRKDRKKCNSEDSKPLHNFLRARTASTETVGKAFNGLGNFLQKFNEVI